MTEDTMGAIFVNGISGAGKTYSVAEMVKQTSWADWKCVSCGAPGSNSHFETEDWPRRNAPPHGWCAPVQNAVTISKELDVVLIGNFEIGGVVGIDDISVGFEAKNSFRRSYDRSCTLPAVIRTLYRSGKVKLVILEALQLTPAVLNEFFEATLPSNRTSIELTTDHDLARQRYLKRGLVHAKLNDVAAQQKKHQTAQERLCSTRKLELSSSEAKNYLTGIISKYRRKHSPIKLPKQELNCLLPRMRFKKEAKKKAGASILRRQTSYIK